MTREKPVQARKSRGLWGSMALGVAMLAIVASPQQAKAGDAEAAAAVLLGAAIILGTRDDHHSHSEQVYYYDRHPEHRWYYREGRRFCDVHHSYHVDYYPSRDRYDYHYRDHGKRYYKNGGDYHHGSHHDRDYRARWNTRVRVH